MIITIDGAAGTGKSTVAKRVAERLQIAYFDTGAMYRAFAYYVMQTHTDAHNIEKVIKLLNGFHFKFDGIGSSKIYYVNDHDVTSMLRTPEVTEVSSVVSQYPEVRNALHQIQKNFAKHHDAVFEGRDLGTVIFPDAEYKFFLKASDHVRAERRYAELKHKGIDVRFDDVLQAIRQRDSRDEGRKVAPLKCAEDAHVIDTSHIDVQEVVIKILQVVGRP